MDSLYRLKPYLRRHRLLLAAGFVAIILSNAFEVLIPLIIREAVDKLQEEATMRQFLEYGAMVVGVTALSGLFSYFTRQTIIVASRKMEFELRNDFYAHLQKLSVSFYNNTTTGDLMAHTTNDINQVRNFLGPGIMYATSTGIGFVIILGIMLSINPTLTLLALLPLPLISVIVFYIGGIVHKKTIRIQEQFSNITSHAQENLSGIRVIKAFTREQFEVDRFKDLGVEYYRRNMSLIRVQSLTRPVLYLLIGISLIIVLWYGGSSVIDGRMTLGDVTAMMIYLGMLIWPMIAFGWVFNIIQRAAASMGRLNKIFDVQPEIMDGPDTDSSIEDLQGHVTFKGVTFSYPGAPVPALKNIDLDIPPGKTVGIIGFTGAGKSTFVSLIPRLYDITEGEVRIDGYPIKQIPVETLRSSIGYVTQETFLFSETIRENIIFGEDRAEEELVERVADIAHLSGDVADFPKKFDTVIGERGITLSGGQKQRASLARALARDPKILILDDAFSAVDTYTEESILSRLRDEIRNRTTLLISHRISTVKQADEIIVLDNGKIVERGTHDELAGQGGIYANLYQKQLLEKELEEM